MGIKRFFVLSLGLAVLIACENPFVRPDAGFENQILIELDGTPQVYNGSGRLIAYQTAYVEVEIYDGSTPTPLVKRTLTLLEENNRLVARGTIPALPPKPQYLLVAKAYESNGTLWTEGNTNFKLVPGGRQTISLKLSPVSTVIVNYPGALDSIQQIIIPARTTHIFKLTVPLSGYYTIDVFNFSNWEKPLVEASCNGSEFKEYQSYAQNHTVLGGMVMLGQEIVFALGNATYAPVTFTVLVRQDGPDAPDGKVLTLDLDYTGSDLVVNSKVNVHVQFYPVPLVLGWSHSNPPPVFTKVIGQTGATSISELASYGRNSWVFRIVHDVNASHWLHGTLSSTHDILSWHKSGRLEDSHLTAWTDVNSLAPNNLGTYPNKVDFDVPGVKVNLGQAVTFKWKENATKPGILPDTNEPNNTSGTATTVPYVGAPAHDGYVINGNFHIKNDVDWFNFNPLPYTDQYELVYSINYPNGGPLKLEFYKSPNLTTPVAILESSQPFETTKSYVFNGTTGETYYVKVLPLVENLSGSYSVTLRLAKENEEAGEVPFTRTIDLEDGWQQFRVGLFEEDNFYFTNPYPTTMEFLAETDWPSPTYSRGNATTFPVTVGWPFLLGPNKGPGPFLNGHPSSWGKLNSNSGSSIQLGTVVKPGRLVNLRVRPWRDVYEFNDTAANAKLIFSDNTLLYGSIHDLADVDWYHVTQPLKRTYRIRMRPSLIKPSASLPVRYEITDNAGNPLIPPVIVLPDSSGMAFYEYTSNGPFKIRTEPANPGQTGVYTFRINQRPAPNDRIAQWSFNGNLNPDVGPTLSGSGYQFVTGSQGQSSTAISFNPASDGKLVAASTPLPLTIAPNTLVFNLWIYIEPQSGANFSRGWILAQEDGSNNLRVGVEVYQISPTYVTVRIHLGTEFFEFSPYTNSWQHLAFSLDGYGAGSKVSFFANDTHLGDNLYTPGDTSSSAPYTLRIGGRAASGTTLNGVRIDNLKIYLMNSGWLINDYYGILEEPR